MPEHQNEHFVRDFLTFHTLQLRKLTFSDEFSYEPTSKSTFRARLPSIFMTCHKMPRLPQNLHPVTTSRSADIAIRRKHATRHVKSAAPGTQNDIGGLQSAAPATKNATHRLETSQKYCACHTKRLLTHLETCCNVTKCHACHAKWSYATLDSSKSDPFCKTCQRHGHSDLARMVANGWATSGEHSSTPTPPEWNGNPCYAFGKNTNKQNKTKQNKTKQTNKLDKPASKQASKQANKHTD